VYIFLIYLFIYLDPKIEQEMAKLKSVTTKLFKELTQISHACVAAIASEKHAVDVLSILDPQTVPNVFCTFFFVCLFIYI